MCMVNPLAACALVIDSLSSFQWTKRKGDGARNLHLGSLYRILSRILATKVGLDEHSYTSFFWS